VQDAAEGGTSELPISSFSTEATSSSRVFEERPTGTGKIDELHEWDEREQRARRQLRNAVGESELAALLGLDAPSIWEQLQSTISKPISVSSPPSRCRGKHLVGFPEYVKQLSPPSKWC
jgi:hypothetical protein